MCFSNGQPNDGGHLFGFICERIGHIGTNFIDCSKHTLSQLCGETPSFVIPKTRFDGLFIRLVNPRNEFLEKSAEERHGQLDQPVYRTRDREIIISICKLSPVHTVLMQEEIISQFSFQSLNFGNRKKADSFFLYISFPPSVNESGTGDLKAVSASNSWVLSRPSFSAVCIFWQ